MSLDRRLRQVESHVGPTDVIPVAVILDDVVELAGKVIPLEVFERYHAPDRNRRAAAIFRQTGRKPITRININCSP